MSSPVIDTPTQTAEAATVAPAAAVKNHPLIRGTTASGRAKRELTLWPNSRATEHELIRPDMTGVLSITATTPAGTTVELKRNVSAWLKFDGEAPRVTIMTNLNDGGKLLGSVRAMKMVQGRPADGARGLRLIGDMELEVEGTKQKFTVTGDLNARYGDRQEMLDSALAMGFPQTMVDAYAKRLEQDAAQRAMNAVAQAGRPTAGARP